MKPQFQPLHRFLLADNDQFTSYLHFLVYCLIILYIISHPPSQTQVAFFIWTAWKMRMFHSSGLRHLLKISIKNASVKICVDFLGGL